MRKYLCLIAILAILVAGCGKKQQEATPTPPMPPVPTAGEGANTLGDLMKKQVGLTSYVMLMDSGVMKSKIAVKMANGKPVAMKMQTNKSDWIIMQLDKKMQYIYNPAMKSVMAMPMTGAAPTSPTKGMPDAEALKALVGQKVTSETIDGVDTLKVSNADGSKVYWVEKEHSLPVQVKEGAQTIKFKYEQINSVPDSEFEVPAGTKIQEMPKMPGMPPMPNIPKMPK